MTTKIELQEEVALLTNRLEHEAYRSAILQDALVCILECTDDSPHTIAEETLEVIAHLEPLNRFR